MVRFATIFVVVAVVGQAAFADLDQSYTATPTASAGVGGGNQSDMAQTFTVGITGQLTSVDVLVRRITDGVSGPLLLDLRTTSAGAPTEADAGGNILATASIAAASVTVGANTGDATFLSVDLSGASLFVTSGDVLALVLLSDAPSVEIIGAGFVNPYFWEGTTADGYAGGSAYRRSTSTWAVPTFITDMDFQVYVTPSASQTIPEPATALLLMAGVGLVALRRRR